MVYVKTQRFVALDMYTRNIANKVRTSAILKFYIYLSNINSPQRNSDLFQKKRYRMFMSVLRVFDVRMSLNSIKVPILPDEHFERCGLLGNVRN